MTGIGFETIAKGRSIGVGEIMFRHNESMTKIYDYDPYEDVPDNRTPIRDYSEKVVKTDEAPF